MRPTIIWTIRASSFDILIEKLPHRGRDHKTIKRSGWQLAVVVVGALQIYDHVALRLVVTNALDEAAARRIAAFKCFEIDGAAIFDVNGFGTNFRC